MGARQTKEPIYDGNACMLYDYMIAQRLTEEDVLRLMQKYDNQALGCPVFYYIQNPNSIPRHLIPVLCRALNAPIEAIFMRSRILNRQSFSIYGRIVRTEKQRIEDIPLGEMVQELKKHGFKVFKEI